MTLESATSQANTVEDAKVFILGYTKKDNARVFDTWGCYNSAEGVAMAQDMLKRNGFYTRVTSTTLYE